MDKVIRKFNAKGEVRLPSSKSYSHRYLIASLLTSDEVIIENLNKCDDVLATLSCVNKLKEFQQIKKVFTGDSDVLILDSKASGSTIRMLLPLALEITNSTKFIGDESLFSRPFESFEEIFLNQNITFKKDLNSLCVKGTFKSYDFIVKNPKSSQFISGLLFLIAYKQKGSIEIVGDVVSRSYIEMTLKVLNDFGYNFELKENKIVFDKKIVTKIDTIKVESDMSALPYFAVLGITGEEVVFKDINFDTIQNDFSFVDVMQKYGGNFVKKDNDLIVRKSELKPFEVDISNCIDLGPIFFSLASMINGRSIIRGIERLRLKESDRISSMINELSKLNIEIVLKESEVEIKGSNNLHSTAIFETYNDHRIAMALSVLGASIDGTSTIKNYECVNKSYTNFFKDMSLLNKPRLTASIYTLDTLNNVKKCINCAVLNNFYSYIYEENFDLDKAIEICLENGIEPIIGLNRIIMEDELGDVSSFIDKYSRFKFLVSDLGVVTLLEEKGLTAQIIYDPDTLICNSSDLNIYQSFGFDSTSLSNEITVQNIIDSYNITKADIFYQVFGRKMMFYSKRKLIKLYKQHKNLNFDSKQLMYLDEKKRGDTFLPTLENKNGFFVFRGYNISLLKEINNLKFLKYMFFESLTINDDSLREIIQTYSDVLCSKISVEEGLNNIKTLEPNVEDGFAYSDTVYVKEKVHQ